MRLWLVRHGDALSEREDPQRPLSPEGQKETNAMAARLRDLGLRPPEIWHSGKCRARQTAQIIHQVSAPDAQLLEHGGLNPNDPTDPIAYELSGRVPDLAIVGHLPFLSRLVSRLLVCDEQRTLVAFPPAGAALLERSPEGHWYLAGLWSSS